MELAFFSAVATADANFLDGVQANNVTKELTRTTNIAAGGEGDDVQDGPLILPQVGVGLLRPRDWRVATTERTLQIVCRRWGEELRSRGHFSKKPPSFGRGFANFLTEITRGGPDALPDPQRRDRDSRRRRQSVIKRGFRESASLCLSRHLTSANEPDETPLLHVS